MLEHVKDALCVVMGSRAHTMTMMAASVGSALLYGITSTSMAFLNKLVLAVYDFNFPMTIMTAQMAVTFTILQVLNHFNFLQLTPLSRKNLTQFSGPTFFYSLNGVLSLAALGQMNLTMYSVLKRNGPLVTMLLSALILNKKFPGSKVVIAVCMMSIGCVVAAKGDITFDLEAYTFGAGSVLSQSLYLILLQKLSDNFSTSDTLYMSSAMSFPVLFLTAATLGEFKKVYMYPRYTDPVFIAMLLLLLCMGSFLNFTLFLCNSNNSALTTTVVGTLKSVAQTTMGMFAFGGIPINTPLLTGVSMSLSGGVFYTYAKYQENEAKKFKKIQSGLSLSDAEKGETGDSRAKSTSIDDNVVHLPQKNDSSESDERIP
ncbi:uncharacterized protein [Watersipora subatra]|uniref:uncharacterized protein n=1 Tax=Watersipora subatra TaxID=2589382 RepID=UPI00355AF1FC